MAEGAEVHLQPRGRVAALGLYQTFGGALYDVVACAERGEDGDDAESARRLQRRVRLAERGAERCREHVVAGRCADDLLEEDADALLVARRQPPTREVSQETAVGHCAARRHRAAPRLGNLPCSIESNHRTLSHWLGSVDAFVTALCVSVR